MDYVFRVIDLPWGFYAISLCILLTIGIISKKWPLAGLSAYIFLVLSITVLSRKPFNGNHFQPKVFWSYAYWQRQKQQILGNIYLFIPVGLLGGNIFNWKIIPLSATLSLLIETTQLITKTGLFEFDDIIYNTLGSIIGFCLYSVVVLIVKGVHKNGFKE